MLPCEYATKSILFSLWNFDFLIRCAHGGE